MLMNVRCRILVKTVEGVRIQEEDTSVLVLENGSVERIVIKVEFGFNSTHQLGSFL